MIGNIEKRGKCSWRLEVSYIDEFGIRQKPRRTIKIPEKNEALAKKLAEKALANFITELEKNQYVMPSKMPFSVFCEKYFIDYGNKNLAPKTIYRYKEMLKSRVIPVMGHLKLDQIKPQHLLALYNNLSEKGIKADAKYTVKDNIDLKKLAAAKGMLLREIQIMAEINERTMTNARAHKPLKFKTANKIVKALDTKIEEIFNISETDGLSDRTISHHHKMISSILQKALQWQFIHDNPASRVEPPKVKKVEIPCYDDITTLRMLDLLDEEPVKYRVIIYFALYGQMREGEIMGLTHSSINTEAKTITIKQASQYIPHVGTFIKDTKNESSERTICLDKDAFTVLEEYLLEKEDERKKAGDLWNESDILFTQWNGLKMHPYTPSKWFKKFIDKNGLPPLTFHGLRHTGITLLIDSGADISSVSSRAGHSQKSTTLNLYTHRITRKDKIVSDKLGSVLRRKKNPKNLKVVAGKKS